MSQMTPMTPMTPMNQATLDERGPRAQSPMRRTGSRALIVVLLILSLLGSGLARNWGWTERANAVAGTVSAGSARTSLSSMNSFALALLLGGLRGPLVMVLWPQLEAMKNERNLEDFDTVAEWIRLLQPEFDTVHLFQIWNKAYNVSVQMASLPNKYATILDALDYARSVLAERPNDISIVTEMARVYHNKLGFAAERTYYRQRVRTETLPVVRVQFPASLMDQYKTALTQAGISDSQARVQLSPQTPTPGQTQTATVLLRLLDGRQLQKVFEGQNITYQTLARQDLRRSDDRTRPTALPTMLNADGRILPQYRQELRHLLRFEPFPQGLSPMALAYEYYKQAIELQDQGQRHIQMTPMILDSQVPIVMRMWDEEEWERGRRAEAQGLGVTSMPSDAPDYDTPTADYPPNAPIVNRQAIETAIFDYDRAIELIEASLEEYHRHLEAYPAHIYTYLSHMDYQQMAAAMMRADRTYLLAMLASGAQRPSLLKQARDQYTEALQWNQVIMLKYYVPSEALAEALPKGSTRADLEATSERPVPKDQYGAILNRVRQWMKRTGFDPFVTDREDHERFVRRITARLQNLGPASAPAANPAPGAPGMPAAPGMPPIRF